MAEITIIPNRRNKYLGKMPDKSSYLKSESRERKLSLLYLINSYLLDQKFYATVESFEKESKITGQYQVCENVDLEIIFQEFQSYYFIKFQKYPKILRKLTENESDRARTAQNHTHSAKTKSQTSANIDKSNFSDIEDFHFEIVSYPQSSSIEEKEKPKIISEKLICDIGEFSNEWKEIANQIIKECFLKPLQVKWDDCIGLANSVEKLKESMVYPLVYPHIFKNMEIYKGVLLFGPPGTGKTLLAKALASESTTFFNVCSSVFTSKWRGESEKMLKVLFDLAKYYAPTTIFIDEIDSLVFSSDHQHDATKRFRSEFLTQVDGINSHNETIFLLGSTNLPWNLDAAILRRFEKRLLIDLPNKEDRRKLLQHYIPKENNLRDQDFEYLATLTENFSGSDIKNLCKEAAMCSIREKISELKIKHKNSEELRSLKFIDIEQAVKKIRPSTISNDNKNYIEWNDKYGSN